MGLVEEGDGVVAGVGDAAVVSVQGGAGAHQVLIRPGTAFTIGMGSRIRGRRQAAPCGHRLQEP
ncbi:hypothetical protein ACFT8V_17085 [Streptomyces griseoincarnatus]